MKPIKFSHDYPKLWGQDTAELLAVRIIDSKDVSEQLREYDTYWFEYPPSLNFRPWSYVGGLLNFDLNRGHYDLPKGKLIQLIFIGNEGVPFCTIRRQTPQKEDYYRKSIGEIFEVKRE